LILVFEDLHWIDTETQGFLDTLSESVASAKILLLTNYRPEYRHEWGQKTYTQLRLVPLGKDEAEEFLDALLGSSPLPTRERDRVRVDTEALYRLKQLILEKTEGTPFFMEEVVQTLAEEGALVGARGNYRLEKVPTELHISPTVQGVLAARIDRLTADEKAFLQQLAVIGREFSLSLVRQVVTQPEEELYRVLASLQNKEFLYEQPAFPEVEYLFKHALTQEVAYRSMLLERRKVLHERIGGTIEALYARSLDEHLTELAHHFSQSGNTGKALQFLERAGKQAASRSAVDEAIMYLTRALETLQALLPGEPRDRRELGLRMQLSVILVAKGLGLEERGRVLEQARVLASRLGTTQELVEVMGQLCQYHIERQQLSAARVLAVEALPLAESTGDTALILEAEYNLGETAFWLGHWTEAAQHWQRTLSLYERDHHGQLYLLFGMDPWIIGAGLLAVVEVVLGKPDHARRRRDEVVEYGRQLGHALSRALSLITSTWVDIVLNDMDACRNTTEALILFSEEQGLSEGKGLGMVWQGWTRLAGGDPDGAINTIASGLADLDLLGSHNADVFGRTHIARAKIHKNDLDGAARELREAAALANRYGAHWTDFDLCYAEAELMLKRGLPDEAEQHLRQAIAIAQQRGLKWYELRATVSLTRLWRQQGKSAEAHPMLSEIYNWFTEGFDTKDLQEAKALLEELT
jgi:tetratricopeptide (TPR) repeat protein